MSDDDKTVVDFKKKLEASKSDRAVSLEDRVVQCMENEDCECKYCTYRDGAAEMVVDILSQDMLQFENNTNSSCCSFDLKDVLFKAIMKVKEFEKELDGSEE